MGSILGYENRKRGNAHLVVCISYSRPFNEDDGHKFQRVSEAEVFLEDSLAIVEQGFE